MREKQNRRRRVMAEAILTREHIEKLSLPQAGRRVTTSFAEIARLAEHFFMSHGPRNRGHGYRQDQQPQDLRAHETPRV